MRTERRRKTRRERSRERCVEEFGRKEKMESKEKKRRRGEISRISDSSQAFFFKTQCSSLIP